MKPLVDLLCANVGLRPGCNVAKSAGDHVMVGNNHGPIFEIVHVHGDLAWLRPISNGEEGLVPLERLRVVEREARH